MITEEQLSAMQISSPLLVEEVRRLRREVMDVRERTEVVTAERDLANAMHQEASRQRDDCAAELEKVKGARDANMALANLHAASAGEAIKARHDAEKQMQASAVALKVLRATLITVREAIASRFWLSAAYLKDTTLVVDQALRAVPR